MYTVYTTYDGPYIKHVKTYSDALEVIEEFLKTWNTVTIVKEN